MWSQFIGLRRAALRCGIRKMTVGFAAAAICSCRLLAQAEAADGVAAPVTWGGLNWGIGIATNFDVSGARVSDATVVNNIVRVTNSSSNVSISFVLESHYFFPGPETMRRAFGYFEPPGGGAC
jgi:hypothetical protein